MDFDFISSEILSNKKLVIKKKIVEWYWRKSRMVLEEKSKKLILQIKGVGKLFDTIPP